MIELWHEWNSVHSLKVRIVLAEKRVAWTSRVVELLEFAHLQPDYLAINPDGVVPTLVHDAVPIYDSSAIVEYLEDAFPEPALRPAAAIARARMRSWLKYHDDVAHPALRNASFELLYKPFLQRIPADRLAALLARHPRPERRQKFVDGARGEIDWTQLTAAVRACDQIAARLDRALDEASPWLLGARFTLADAAMAPFAERIENLGLSDTLWRGRERGADWAERLLARPSIAASRAPASHRLARPPRAVLDALAARLISSGSIPPGSISSGSISSGLKSTE
jgi:glutathione S-transferase